MRYDCGEHVIEGKPGKEVGKHSLRIPDGKAMCRKCCRKSTDLYYGMEAPMTETVLAKPMPELDLRDGEPLEMAIADAERKARVAREQANTSIALAEKWEAVAAQLQKARDLSRTPATSIKKQAPPPAPTKDRRPHGFWTEAVLEIMRSFPPAVVGPTKNEVYRCLRKRYPDDANHCIYEAVNAAIRKGAVIFRSPNNLYLPENIPGAGIVAASLAALA